MCINLYLYFDTIPYLLKNQRYICVIYTKLSTNPSKSIVSLHPTFLANRWRLRHTLSLNIPNTSDILAELNFSFISKNNRVSAVERLYGGSFNLVIIPGNKVSHRSRKTFQSSVFRIRMPSIISGFSGTPVGDRRKSANSGIPSGWC
jgi:hypothetical protein